MHSLTLSGCCFYLSTSPLSKSQEICVLVSALAAITLLGGALFLLANQGFNLGALNAVASNVSGGATYAMLTVGGALLFATPITLIAIRTFLSQRNSFNHLEDLAASGDAVAQNTLGLAYLHGVHAEIDLNRAAALFRHSADQGCALAKCDLGLCLLEGYGVDQDEQEAIRLFREAAEEGVTKAQFLLGFCYDKGVGVASDMGEAVLWYQLAADQEYPEAQCNLGICLLNGWGVVENPVEGLRLLRRAAEQNIPQAQCHLGMYLWESVEGLEEAVQLFRQAAEQGVSEAYCLLGYCYLYGYGVTIDYGEAPRLFRYAAEQGVPAAQYELGCLLKMGRAIAQDQSEAIHWFQRAAEKNDERAHYELGLYYYSSNETVGTQDSPYFWMWKAARQGHGEAIAWIRSTMRNNELIPSKAETIPSFEQPSKIKIYSNGNSFFSRENENKALQALLIRLKLFNATKISISQYGIVVDDTILELDYNDLKVLETLFTYVPRSGVEVEIEQVDDPEIELRTDPEQLGAFNLDIWKHILADLEVSARLNLGKTNHTFYALTHDPSFWKNFRISTCISSNQLYALLCKYGKHIETVEIDESALQNWGESEKEELDTLIPYFCPGVMQA